MTHSAERPLPMSRSEQKRQQVLVAAIDLFCRQGFPHTSMDEVARLAGVSKQTVYSHYGSKDELFVAAIESKCVGHNLNDDLLKDPAQPESTLTQFALQFGDVIVSPEAITVFKACVAQSDSHPEVSRLFFEAGPKHMVAMLSGYLASVEALGQYRFGNAHHCAVRLCLMLFGELKLRLELGLDVEGLMQERETYIRGCAEMFLKAYRV
ncbi:TetR/AcrR family transcriptional regulator [Shewanella sp. KJ2020]|uniref:TetR/AcrR family transcriptional regulator n=1 Tax=Shewanella sp. KJ2020 TaxID=2919172 RepID=UPI0020A76A98|nr:TetR/AcrR family transcriptional regulator [Shewanella sp. KJ2020]MCP3130246.1 TetR/AcrR family transcriptional regulator [Shewanella sp. KJ2020]